MMSDAEEAAPPFKDAADGAPPSYESLYGKIKHAKQESDGTAQFVKSACDIIVNTLGFTIMIGILMILPVTMIVIGALNLDNCPAQRMIPIWLVVGGSVSALIQLMSIVIKAKAKCEGVEEEEVQQNSKVYKLVNSVTGCFNFGWFIAGNVWVYGMYSPDNTNDPTLDNYCDHLTYYFSFWAITIVYIMLALGCFCVCFCALAFAKKAENN